MYFLSDIGKIKVMGYNSNQTNYGIVCTNDRKQIVPKNKGGRKNARE